MKNASGIHARPASMIVKEASRYISDFYVHLHGYRINGKSILGLLTLAAEMGAEIELEMNGPDEQEAMDTMVALFENNFRKE